MKLELESGAIIDPVAVADLERIEDEEFAILSQTEFTYLQCACDGPDEYILEYQEGSVAEHFAASDAPFTFAEIHAAFVKYLEGDPSWKQDFQWEWLQLE